MAKSKRIRVKRHYRRVGSSHRVAPGDYRIDDPALHGWGNDLVETGQADVIETGDEPSAEAAAELTTDDEITLDPNTLSTEELISALEDLGVDVAAIAGSGKGGKVVKADLVAAYQEASGV